MRRGIVVGLMVALLAACSNDDGSADSSTTEKPDVDPTTTTAEPTSSTEAATGLAGIASECMDDQQPLIAQETPTADFPWVDLDRVNLRIDDDAVRVEWVLAGNVPAVAPGFGGFAEDGGSLLWSINLSPPGGDTVYMLEVNLIGSDPSANVFYFDDARSEDGPTPVITENVVAATFPLNQVAELASDWRWWAIAEGDASDVEFVQDVCPGSAESVFPEEDERIPLVQG